MRRAVFERERAAAGRPDRRPGDRLRGGLDDGHRSWLARRSARRRRAAADAIPAATRGRTASRDVSTERRSGLLEIFNNQFAGIAEQMGVTLRNTASSVNVKERLDFSCAIFTADGRPGGQRAAHARCTWARWTRRCGASIADNPDMQPGDVFVTNDPYRGGSHLPDVTVITPVHDAATGELLFFTASRAHHAEIGGIVPGSMPPFSKNLAEEGVLIRNFKLVDAGQSRFDELRELLLVRTVSDAQRRRQPGRRRGPGRGQSTRARAIWPRSSSVTRCRSCEAYMQHIQDAAETKMRPALAALARRPRTSSSIIWTTARRSRVTITIAGDRGHDRLHRHRPGARRQPQRQSGDRHRGGDVLPAAADRRGHSAQPRRAGAGRRSCCRSACSIRRSADAGRRAPRSRAATWRRRSAWSTCCWARWAWPRPARGR